MTALTTHALFFLLAQLWLQYSADAIQEFHITRNQPLEQLQGHDIINPQGLVAVSVVTLVPLRIYNDPLIQFTASAYRNDKTGVALPFGPTIRVKRGSDYIIHLTNALPAQPGTESEGVANKWSHPTHTNLHAHGMHADLGVPSQEFAASGAYYRGDNPFFKLPPGRNASVTFKLRLPKNHLPGMHWYHPHFHHSTILQSGTAHGVIIVEDDNSLWLPAENGCAEVASVLAKVTDTILDIQFYFFKTPNPANGTRLAVLPEELRAVANITDDLNNGNFQFISKEAQNPLCCDEKIQKEGSAGSAANPPLKSITGSAIQGRGQNFYLVNGGFQPILHLTPNTWARWRLLNSASKGFAVVKIVDSTTNKTASDCELQLLAKDGVYLLQIPRKIDAMLLSAASRAEVLVRCSGSPGTKYYLSAGDSEPFSSANFMDDEASGIDHLTRHLYFKQDVLATIEMRAGDAAAAKAGVGLPGPAIAGGVLQQPLEQRKCTPRRPPYAADLRDANLAANGYNTSDVVTIKSAFTPQYLPKGMVQSSLMTWGCGVTKSDGENHLFSVPDPNPITLELGKVVQLDFEDLAFHPLHVHTNPYQIQTLEKPLLCSTEDISGNRTESPNGRTVCSYTPYFEPGDYHDTLTLPMVHHDPWHSQPAALRFQPGEFSGYALMHCHFLLHEDTGCMSVVWFKCPSLPADKQTGPCPGFAWSVPADVDEDGNVTAARLAAAKTGDVPAGQKGLAQAQNSWGTVAAGAPRALQLLTVFAVTYLLTSSWLL